MKFLKDFVFMPMRIMSRIILGSVGFMLMGGGLLLMDPLGIAVAGVPLFLIGLLLLVKSIF